MSSWDACLRVCTEDSEERGVVPLPEGGVSVDDKCVLFAWECVCVVGVDACVCVTLAE